MDPSKLDFMRLAVPNGLIFSTFSMQEILCLSAKKLTTPLSFNTLGHPLAGGLYDPSLGPFDKNTICQTCSLNFLKCPGHLGHIELPLPIINPLYHKLIVSLLKVACLNCHRILIPADIKYILIGQLKLLDAGLLTEALELEKKFSAQMKQSGETNNEGNLKSLIDEYLIKANKFHIGKVVECKGQDYRSLFIKKALSNIFKGKVCPFCKCTFKSIKVIKNRILVPDLKLQVAEKFKGEKKKRDSMMIGGGGSSGLSFLVPSQCKTHLEQIWIVESEFIQSVVPLIGYTNEVNPVDALFMSVVPVSPPNARPVSLVDGRMVEHPLNTIYRTILNDCLVLKSIIHIMNNDGGDTLSEERREVVDALKGATYEDKLQNAWHTLQMSVNSLLDVDNRKSRSDGIGLKQIIEKKQGIIRMNMMGKRVNYAARTVITPDPNLNVDEVGVPAVFATKLTYPVPVTMWNANDLRNLVKNGPNIYPGANFVENEDGSVIKLDGNNEAQRAGVAKRLLTPGDSQGIKIVHRHLINGDILLLNRQPTLHKPSIMAHRARVLKGEKTFRMHYANCKSYNADFDGDEMNAHFPQNEVARSEGYNIVSVCKQYLVPKDGTPLSGLIQDHVVSGVKLTMRGKFFTKNEYMHLVFQGLSSKHGEIVTMRPAIIKPYRMWSGKQVVSTILKNITPNGWKTAINLTSTSKIPAKAWETPSKKTTKSWFFGINELTNTMTEAEVIFRNGELLCGVLDKTHYGATPYSLVHCVHELYGGDVATTLLSCLAKLFTAFLQMEGFTLGVQDILVVKKADKARKTIIDKVRTVGESIAKGVVDVKSGESVEKAICQAYKKETLFRAILDHQYKKSLDSYNNNINKTCLPSGLLTPFPLNNLQLMVQSGAKGSTVNTMQISCLLGQIELEGRRPPLMLSGRALPSFPPYDTSPRAGGFIDARFMTGIPPQEFFFHCMAGREGLIDTAVKTSRSGYLQRCLVKHLEGLTVHYDQTVRDYDGSVVQFLYGEDGMEVTKCQFLKEEQIPFLVENFSSLYKPEEIVSLKENTDIEAVKKYHKLVKKWNKHRVSGPKQWCSPFSLFSLQIDGSHYYEKPSSDNGRTKSTEMAMKRWTKMDAIDRAGYEKMIRQAPDPLNAKFQSDRHFGSITEKLDLLIENYLKHNKHLLIINEKELKSMLYQRSMSALCQPGEPVGLLAAQSVGEPSTQMTLNTFHFAGRGEMNVTLGIPRLREILMTASKNIKTPSVTVPFTQEMLTDSEKKMNKLRKHFTKVRMVDVLETVTVTQKLDTSFIPRRPVYILKVLFLPQVAYKENSLLTPKQLIEHVEKVFIKELVNHIQTKGNKVNELINSEKELAKLGSNGDDNDDADVNDEGGGSGEKKVNKRTYGVDNDDYQSSEEEPENEDDDATTVKRRVRKNEEQQYSDLEDDEEAQADFIENDQIKINDDEQNIDENVDDDMNLDESKTELRVGGVRKTSVITSNDNIIDYRFDTENYRWCEITLGFPLHTGRIDMIGKLKDVANISIIRQVPGIKRAFITTEMGNVKCLKTEGQNLHELYKYSRQLDINKLYTNDINAVQTVYGIEAAAKLMVKEILQVFKVYGITVDVRHLNLIADYMTWTGEYKPLNRKAMDGHTSPLQQMSFESASGFLKTAVTRHKAK